MASDLFMTANGYLPFINGDDMYQLAKSTVEANMRGIKVDDLLAQLADRIESESAEFDALLDERVLEIFPKVAELRNGDFRERHHSPSSAQLQRAGHSTLIHYRAASGRVADHYTSGASAIGAALKVIRHCFGPSAAGR
jgi:hypothetical protein